MFKSIFGSDKVLHERYGEAKIQCQCEGGETSALALIRPKYRQIIAKNIEFYICRNINYSHNQTKWVVKESVKPRMR